MLFRCDIDVGVPTDIDGDRCILLCTRLTVNMTGDLSGELWMVGKNRFVNKSIVS